MKKIEIKAQNCKVIPWEELKTYEFNDLKSIERDINKLKNAISNNGFCFPFYVWSGHRYVIDGNGRNLALQELEKEGFQILDLPIVEIKASNKREAKKLVLQASSEHGKVTNESFSNFSFDLELSTIEMEEFNFDLPTMTDNEKDENEELDEDNEKDENEELEDFWGDDFLPEQYFLSEPKYGIPYLLPEKQATAITMPVVQYSSLGRIYEGFSCTMNFYTFDYRWSTIWKNPLAIKKYNPLVICEPNFSTTPQTPLSFGLFLIYKKRWLNRFWQQLGLTTFVDLHVGEQFEQYNLLGVPEGWLAYSTRGDDLTRLKKDIATACNHAKTDKIFLLVWGGGAKTKAFCEKNGYYYFAREH